MNASAAGGAPNKALEPAAFIIWVFIARFAPRLSANPLAGQRNNIVAWMAEERRRITPWHRGAFALAAAVLLLFTLMGWEHGAYVMFGIPVLICVWLALWPTRLGAAILFWPFLAGACLFGWLLVRDLTVLSQGGAPSVLLDTDDSVVFVVLELTLIALSVLFCVIGRPFAARRLRRRIQ